MNTEAETNFYTFGDLSEGTYTLSLLLDGREVYKSGNFYVGEGINKVMTPITFDKIVRFKVPKGIILFLPYRCDGSTDEDGYLMKDGESAFLVSGSSMTLGRVVERYAEEDGNI